MTSEARRGLLVALLFLMLLSLPAVVRACPGCKESLFDPGQMQQKRSTAKGYALSIGLLLAMPAGLIGGVTTLVVRAHRRRPKTRIDTISGSR